jgi:hypothetical protein
LVSAIGSAATSAECTVCAQVVRLASTTRFLSGYRARIVGEHEHRRAGDLLARTVGNSSPPRQSAPSRELIHRSVSDVAHFDNPRR